jgi:peptidoglycan-associated lipoprotein
MKNTVKRLLPLLSMAILIQTGCAKQEVVRKDEAIAPSASAKQAAPAPATPAVAPAKTPEKPAAAAANPAPAPAGVQQKTAAADAPATAAELQRQLEKIYFDFDSPSLGDAARKTLTGNAAVLKRNPLVRVRVEGHCDERGSDEYNLALGERRARSAVRYLETLGVASGRLSTVSYGKEKPVETAHDETAWAKNRRDEFVIVR